MKKRSTIYWIFIYLLKCVCISRVTPASISTPVNECCSCANHHSDNKGILKQENEAIHYEEFNTPNDEGNNERSNNNDTFTNDINDNITHTESNDMNNKLNATEKILTSSNEVNNNFNDNDTFILINDTVTENNDTENVTKIKNGVGTTEYVCSCNSKDHIIYNSSENNITKKIDNLIKVKTLSKYNDTIFDDNENAFDTNKVVINYWTNDNETNKMNIGTVFNGDTENKRICSDKDSSNLNVRTMYIAGYDDQIYRMKQEVQESSGNEILVYFYLYKNTKYYSLGHLYTCVKCLRDVLLKYTHYYCVDDKFVMQDCCFDGIKKNNSDKEIIANDLKEKPVEFEVTTLYPNKIINNKNNLTLDSDKNNNDTNIDLCKLKSIGNDVTSDNKNVSSIFFKINDFDDSEEVICYIKGKDGKIRVYNLKGNVSDIGQDDVCKTLDTCLVCKNESKDHDDVLLDDDHEDIMAGVCQTDYVEEEHPDKTSNTKNIDTCALRQQDYLNILHDSDKCKIPNVFTTSKPCSESKKSSYDQPYSPSSGFDDKKVCQEVKNKIPLKADKLLASHRKSIDKLIGIPKKPIKHDHEYPHFYTSALPLKTQLKQLVQPRKPIKTKYVPNPKDLYQHPSYHPQLGKYFTPQRYITPSDVSNNFGIPKTCKLIFVSPPPSQYGPTSKSSDIPNIYQPKSHLNEENERHLLVPKDSVQSIPNIEISPENGKSVCKPCTTTAKPEGVQITCDTPTKNNTSSVISRVKTLPTLPSSRGTITFNRKLPISNEIAPHETTVTKSIIDDKKCLIPSYDNSNVLPTSFKKLVKPTEENVTFVPKQKSFKFPEAIYNNVRPQEAIVPKTIPCTLSIPEPTKKLPLLIPKVQNKLNFNLVPIDSLTSSLPTSFKPHSKNLPFNLSPISSLSTTSPKVLTDSIVSKYVPTETPVSGEKHATSWPLENIMSKPCLSPSKLTKPLAPLFDSDRNIKSDSFKESQKAPLLSRSSVPLGMIPTLSNVPHITDLTTPLDLHEQQKPCYTVKPKNNILCGFTPTKTPICNKLSQNIPKLEITYPRTPEKVKDNIPKHQEYVQKPKSFSPCYKPLRNLPVPSTNQTLLDSPCDVVSPYLSSLPELNLPKYAKFLPQKGIKYHYRPKVSCSNLKSDLPTLAYEAMPVSKPICQKSPKQTKSPTVPTLHLQLLPTPIESPLTPLKDSSKCTPSQVLPSITSSHFHASKPCYKSIPNIKKLRGMPPVVPNDEDEATNFPCPISSSNVLFGLRKPKPSILSILPTSKKLATKIQPCSPLPLPSQKEDISNPLVPYLQTLPLKTVKKNDSSLIYSSPISQRENLETARPPCDISMPTKEFNLPKITKTLNESLPCAKKVCSKLFPQTILPEPIKPIVDLSLKNNEPIISSLPSSVIDISRQYFRPPISSMAISVFPKLISKPIVSALPLPTVPKMGSIDFSHPTQSVPCLPQISSSNLQHHTYISPGLEMDLTYSQPYLSTFLTPSSKFKSTVTPTSQTRFALKNPKTFELPTSLPICTSSKQSPNKLPSSISSSPIPCTSFKNLESPVFKLPEFKPTCIPNDSKLQIPFVPKSETLIKPPCSSFPFSTFREKPVRPVTNPPNPPAPIPCSTKPNLNILKPNVPTSHVGTDLTNLRHLISLPLIKSPIKINLSTCKHISNIPVSLTPDTKIGYKQPTPVFRICTAPKQSISPVPQPLISISAIPCPKLGVDDIANLRPGTPSSLIRSPQKVMSKMYKTPISKTPYSSIPKSETCFKQPISDMPIYTVPEETLCPANYSRSIPSSSIPCIKKPRITSYKPPALNFPKKIDVRVELTNLRPSISTNLITSSKELKLLPKSKTTLKPPCLGLPIAKDTRPTICRTNLRCRTPPRSIPCNQTLIKTNLTRLIPNVSNTPPLNLTQPISLYLIKSPTEPKPKISRLISIALPVPPKSQMNFEQPASSLPVCKVQERPVNPTIFRPILTSRIEIKSPFSVSLFPTPVETMTRKLESPTFPLPTRPMSISVLPIQVYSKKETKPPIPNLPISKVNKQATSPTKLLFPAPSLKVPCNAKYKLTKLKPSVSPVPIPFEEKVYPTIFKPSLPSFPLILNPEFQPKTNKPVPSVLFSLTPKRKTYFKPPNSSLPIFPTKEQIIGPTKLVYPIPCSNIPCTPKCSLDIKPSVSDVPIPSELELTNFSLPTSTVTSTPDFKPMTYKPIATGPLNPKSKKCFKTSVSASPISTVPKLIISPKNIPPIPCTEKHRLKNLKTPVSPSLIPSEVKTHFKPLISSPVFTLTQKSLPKTYKLPTIPLSSASKSTICLKQPATETTVCLCNNISKFWSTYLNSDISTFPSNFKPPNTPPPVNEPTDSVSTNYIPTILTTPILLGPKSKITSKLSSSPWPIPSPIKADQISFSPPVLSSSTPCTAKPTISPIPSSKNDFEIPSLTTSTFPTTSVKSTPKLNLLSPIPISSISEVIPKYISSPLPVIPIAPTTEVESNDFEPLISNTTSPKSPFTRNKHTPTVHYLMFLY